eukprot:7011230-Prymnesium_polylepis.1
MTADAENAFCRADNELTGTALLILLDVGRALADHELPAGVTKAAIVRGLEHMLDELSVLRGGGEARGLA